MMNAIIEETDDLTTCERCGGWMGMTDEDWLDTSHLPVVCHECKEEFAEEECDED